MRTRPVFAAALAVLCGAFAARAQVVVETEVPVGTAAHVWSVHTGETVALGQNVVSGSVGFPGLSAGYIHGLTPDSDIGARFDLLYSLENTTHTTFGVGLAAPYRLVVMRNNNLSVLVHADPGIKLYPSVGAGTDSRGNSTSSTLFGLSAASGVQLGIQLMPNLRGEVGVDLPLTLYVTPSLDLAVSPQVGGGLEYYLDKNLSVGLDTRFGPLFVPTTSGAGSQFAFRTQLVAGYRL